MEITDSVFVYRLAGGDRLSWHGRYHAHGSKEFEIHFFLEGEGSFRCNSTRYPISGGRLFLTGPREFHSIVPEAVSRPLSWYAFLFTFGEDASAENVRLRERLDSVLSSRHTVLTVNPNFRFQFEDLLQLSRSPDPALRDSARHLLSSFLWRWFGRIDPADVESSGSPLPSVNVLQSNITDSLQRRCFIERFRLRARSLNRFHQRIPRRQGSLPGRDLLFMDLMSKKCMSKKLWRLCRSRCANS